MDARPPQRLRLRRVNREAQRPEKAVLGRLHKSEEVREVHDAGHIRVREFHFTDNRVLVSHADYLASTSASPCSKRVGTLAKSETAWNRGSKSENNFPI